MDELSADEKMVWATAFAVSLFQRLGQPLPSDVENPEKWELMQAKLSLEFASHAVLYLRDAQIDE